MIKPPVAVIVLNYNGARWIERCMGSLIETDYEDFKVILVDNASTDGSANIVQAKFPQVEVILNPDNEGFSEGNNIGIRKALADGASYVVLLNPDTIVEPEWLRELIEAGEIASEAGILGAVQLGYENDEFNSWTVNALAQYLDELDQPARARLVIPVDWVEGACFAVKSQVFDVIGFLDPIYTAFYEEIDFCRRAACRGFQTVVVPRSRIHHYRGGIWQSDARLHRMRNYLCDRSQFIYNLTEPRHSLFYNAGWYLVTLATKAKEVIKEKEITRAWDLFRMQFDLAGSLALILSKWRKERVRYGIIG
ncbi:MAG: glycosyltransferase family 2 protein [Acidobacteriota bacterium]